MGTFIEITIIINSDAEIKISVDDGVTPREILDELISAEIGLTEYNQEGERQRYMFKPRGTDMVINENQSLAAANVQDGDSINIVPVLIPGGYKSSSKDPLLIRLYKEYEEISTLCRRSDLIDFEVHPANKSNPPNRYILTYRVKSIIGINLDQSPVYGDKHIVEVYLPPNYPLVAPVCEAKTSIWHPNISFNHEPKGHICINKEKVLSGQTLYDLALYIGNILQYKSYHALNTPPFPEDKTVAKWVREYAEPNNIVSNSKGIVIDDRPLFKESEEYRSSRKPKKKVTIKGISILKNGQSIPITSKSVKKVKILS